MICPKCNAVCKPNAVYCSMCGEKVTMPKICINKECQAYNQKLDDDEYFCRYCGKETIDDLPF